MNGPNHADKRSIERKLLCLYYLFFFFCVLYCPQNQSHNRAGGGALETIRAEQYRRKHSIRRRMTIHQECLLHPQIKFSVKLILCSDSTQISHFFFQSMFRSLLRTLPNGRGNKESHHYMCVFYTASSNFVLPFQKNIDHLTTTLK